MIRFTCLCFLSLICFLTSFESYAGSTLDRIKKSSVVRCGVRTTAGAYAYKDNEGIWQGLEPELCRVIAVAITGRSDAIQIIPVNKEEGFKKLEEKQIDVLMGATPWTVKNDFSLRSSFPAIFSYSALGFIGHENPEISSMQDYKDARVCVENDSYIVNALTQYSKTYGLGLRLMILPDLGRARALLFLNRCDLIFDRIETLHAPYFKETPKTVQLAVLPEIVKTFATGPYLRNDDPEMFKLVQFVIYGLITAEKKKITAQNIDDFQNTSDLEIKTLLSENSAIATTLGLDPKYMYRTLSEMGNYGEIYNRTLGRNSQLKLKRTANRLWVDGGLMWAPTFEE